MDGDPQPIGSSIQATRISGRPAAAGQETGALLAILLLAFALRLVQLGAGSLWYDETVSVFLAGKPVAGLIAHTGRDIHPPGYYLLLRAWLLLTGYPSGHADPAGHGLEFTAAFLSLCFGVLLVPLTWRLARKLGLSEPGPLLAALLIALSPFGVWYSQEVRMYTLGAALGLICLLATAPFLKPATRPSSLRRATLIYALATAAGLYALYYFAFLSVAINLVLLPLLRRRRAALITWLAAQAGALLLYLPWLPTAWRQATNPPVPPWRTAPHLLDVLLESWSALSFGQSANPARFWPFLLLTAALVALGLATRHRQPATRLLLTAAFGPPALILLASLLTPLYHVRYLFTYSPAFSVLLALGLTRLWRWQRAAGRGLMITALALLLLGSSLSLRNLWRDPQFVADDLRAAVRELADRWRPGDVILVNAGYAYPALLIYWPGPVAWHGRLSDFGPDQAKLLAGSAPVILQTGHVDGDPDLGWGNPRSDFYALPATVMQARLSEIAGVASRLWQLRIYDTVNDPAGLIRQELNSAWSLFDDRVYPGEANLRVQGFLSRQRPASASVLAGFAGWLNLYRSKDEAANAVVAGQPLDLPATWSRMPDAAGQPVALSLRLVDEAGQLWAQYDERLGGNIAGPDALDWFSHPLHLPVPIGVPPRQYRLHLVVYDPQNGQPLTITSGPSTGQSNLDLGQVTVLRPAPGPEPRPALADFGLLRLIEARTPATVISPGDSVPVSLLWQAAADFAGEELVVVLQLLDGGGRVAASLEVQPLAGRYPTSQWLPGEIVRDHQQLSTPVDISPGKHTLIVGLYRASDGQRLTTRGPFPGIGQRDVAPIQAVDVRGN